MQGLAKGAGGAERGGALSEGAIAIARGLRRRSMAPKVIGSTACLLDAIALGLGLWFAKFAASTLGFDPLHEAKLAAIGATCVVLVLWIRGAYRLAALRRFWRGVAVLLALGLLVAAYNGVQPLAAVALALFVAPARALGAALAAAALDFGLTERRAVIIGGGERGARVMAALAAVPNNDIRICGIFDDRDDARSPRWSAACPSSARWNRWSPSRGRPRSTC